MDRPTLKLTGRPLIGAIAYVQVVWLLKVNLCIRPFSRKSNKFGNCRMRMPRRGFGFQRGHSAILPGVQSRYTSLALVPSVVRQVRSRTHVSDALCYLVASES
jgi:hypothetical protein